MGSAVGAFCPSPSLLLSRIRASQRLSPAMPIICAMAPTAPFPILLPSSMKRFAVYIGYMPASQCLVSASLEISRPWQLKVQHRMQLTVDNSS